MKKWIFGATLLLSLEGFSQNKNEFVADWGQTGGITVQNNWAGQPSLFMVTSVQLGIHYGANDVKQAAIRLHFSKTTGEKAEIPDQVYLLFGTGELSKFESDKDGIHEILILEAHERDNLYNPVTLKITEHLIHVDKIDGAISGVPLVSGEAADFGFTVENLVRPAKAP